MNVGTGERWRERDIPAALDRLSKADRLIGHNVMRYDLPMLEKVYGWSPPPWVKIADTKVIARLIFPNVMETDGGLIKTGRMPPGDKYRGSHSIAAWGYRLGVPKLFEDITDWSEWTPDMEDRCASDVEVNLALWDRLHADEYSQDAVELEHRIELLVWRMETAGVPFNERRAGALQSVLLERRAEVEPRLVAQFGSWLQPVSPNPEKSTIKPKRTGRRQVILPDGSVTREQYWSDVPYTKLKRATFNPKSHQHIEKQLRKLGWVPTEFTPSGQAKMDENVINAVVERYPEMEGLGQLVMINKRLSQLVEGDQALLKNVQADGRIHAAINPMGTQTGRASHYHPNLSQVPGMDSPYGPEFRECFEMPPGWALVGADQSGLEGRGLSHYLAAFDGGAYWKVFSSGDPHWYSARALGFVGPTEERDKHSTIHTIVRQGGKRFYYAYIYGAMEFKCGEIILETAAAARAAGDDKLYRRYFGTSQDPKGDKLLWGVGKDARETFARGILGLDRLVEIATGQVRQFGALRGLDGRIIPARALHSALNYLIQNSGAVICKRWGVEAYDEIERRGYRHGWDGDFVFCLWSHDEYQVAARAGLENEIGEILVQKAKEAGEHYKFRVPLDSEYSVGRTWADTH